MLGKGTKNSQILAIKVIITTVYTKPFSVFLFEFRTKFGGELCRLANVLTEIIHECMYQGFLLHPLPPRDISSTKFDE